MITVVTIVGARPQIIKAAAFSRAITKNFPDKIQEIIVHTGQHYDAGMSQVFFDELGIPSPNYNLNVGSGAHGKQTADMIVGIEKVLEQEKPACIVLYGDTNSTLAGAIAASKIHVPIVHIEAGLRSFNKKMPEEVNRILGDHVATLLFSPTKTGYDNLINEGFKPLTSQTKATFDHPQIYHCGDVMYDNSLHFATMAEEKTNVLLKNNLVKNQYILSTLHRNNNTDEPNRLNAIFRAFLSITKKEKLPIVLPLHPRTSKMLPQNLEPAVYAELRSSELIKIMEPVGFLEMTALEKNAKLIVTDSGGVQKEAYFFEKPCVVLRHETEWVELIETGAALIADADEKKIVDGVEHFLKDNNRKYAPLFGDGKAAEFICSEIVKTFA